MIDFIDKSFQLSLACGEGVRGMRLLFIDWQPSVEAFSVGSFAVRWYGLMWMLGLLGAYLIVQRLYKHQGIEREKFEPLFFYCLIGVLLGARLGHCLFYEPSQYLTSMKGVVEMFLPIRFMPDGETKFTGYEGLASHGGTIGLFLALVLYCRQQKVKAWLVLDFVGIAAPLTSCFIRLGNLMNSEIIGTPTDVPWGFIFHTREALVNGEFAPRHPAQLYESMMYLVIFFVSVYLYRRWRKSVTPQTTASTGMWKANAAAATENKAADSSPLRPGTGFYFGFCLTTIFTFRFFIEFLKKEQVAFEQGMLLDMGQLLSIPLVIVGAGCMIYAWKKNKN